MPSKDPARAAEAGKRYREKHREELLIRHREEYRRNKETYQKYARDYRARNKGRWRAQHAAYQRRRRADLRNEVLGAYGELCNCCGETIRIFLEIDHIHGGGNAHRRELGVKGGLRFYQWLKKQGFPKDRFQLLCANCNKGRMKNGGVCPHKQQQ